MDRKIVSLLREISPAISAGILTADMMRLESEVRLLEDASYSLLHFDVMDGNFVPALTLGAPFVKGIRTKLLKDAHLMVSNPLERISEFVAAGSDLITIHPESTTHAHRALQKIRESVNANDPARGIAAGIAINPGTPLSVLEPLLDLADIVFILAVNPGFSGQKFIPAAKERFAQVRDMLRKAGRDREVLVGIDGGVTRQNIAEVAATGADVIISGSAIFDGKAAADNAKFMQDALRSAAIS